MLEHLVANLVLKPSSKDEINAIDELNLSSNASTGTYTTKYYFNAPIFNNDDLEKMIKLQYETIKQKNFDESAVQSEKKIILQESLSKLYSESVERITSNIALKNLLNIDDSSPLIGSLDSYSINNVTKNDVVDFYNKYYRPENMLTTIVGNVDANTIKIISKYFNLLQE